MRKLQVLFCWCCALASLVILAPAASAVSDKLIEDANAAFAAQEREDHGEAIRLFSRVLASPELPSDDIPKAYVNRGKSYLRSGEFDRAIVDFNEAIRLKKDLAEAYAYRGAVYLNKSQDDKAIIELDRAIRLKPSYPDAHYYRGVAYLRKEQMERAISEFDEAIRLNPKYAAAYHKRGLAHAIVGKFKEAIPDYDVAIERSPAYAIVYSDRAIAYSETGSPERAIADLDTAIRLGADDAETHYRRGLLLFQQKREERYVDALNDFEATIRLQPERADAYVMSGRILAGRGERDRAIENYTKAIRLRPNDLGAYINRGLTFQFKGEVQPAMADFDTAIRLKPALAETYLYRGSGYAQKGAYDLAYKDLNEALRLKPDDDLRRQVFRVRAGVYFAEGRFENAAKDFEAVFKMSPNDDYAMLWLHLAQARIGEAGIEDMARNASQFDTKKWPGLLIMFYMGKLTADEMPASAKVNGNAEEQTRRECAMTFHEGEYELLRKNTNTAKQLFKQAASTCPPITLEKIIAPAELRRIGG